MRLIPDEDQEELRGIVRDFLRRHCDEEAVRREMATERGWDVAVWRRAAEQLGLAGLEIPEELGGSGAGFGEVAIVLEETGRSLTCLPYFSTVVLGVGVLLLGDDEQARKDLLPSLAEGARTATLALAGPTGGWDPASPTVTAARGDDGWILDGVAGFVVDGRTADLVLVAAGTDGQAGPSVFAVEAPAPGLLRTPLTALDPTRKLARLEFTGTPARLLGAPGAAGPLLDRVLDRAVTALACEQVGGAQATLDAAVEYARQRLQFGRPIGSFQAIKHTCADMLQHVEAARAAAAWAVAAAVEGGSEAPVAAAMAAVRCAEAFRFTAGESIQVHGGIGFTWEHPAHLYFRRAASSAELFGSPAAHREQLLERIGT